MKRLLLAATVLAGMALGGAAAQAALVIDQNQPAAPVYMAGFSQTGLAQSFTPGQTNVAGAGIFLQPGQGAGSTTITLSLWTLLPNVPGAVQLATSSGTAVASGVWFDVFWSPVGVTAGTTYYLTFSGGNNYGVAGSTANPYAGGQTYANAGYGSFPSFDYTFRTYYETAAVPEPATIALFGLGLVGLAGVARRRHAG